MKTFVTVLLVLAMLGTLGVLFAGILGFVRSSNDPERSNRLMRWRVLMQGLALVLLVILLTLMRP